MSRIKLILLSLLAVVALSAVASASASAANLQWEVCEEVAGEGKEPPTKYDNHKCNTQVKPLAERKWQWNKLEKGDVRAISSLGGPQKLIGHVGGVAIEIECTEVENIGKIFGGKPGTDWAEVIYHGCHIVGAPACGLSAKSPKRRAGVISLDVKTVLVELAEGKMGDKFEPESGTTFVEIELGQEEEEATQKYKKACGVFPKAAQKVEGSTVGLAETGAEGNLCEKLNFTNPAQEGSSLKFSGEEALYVGKVEIEMENHWAARCS